MQVAVDGSDLKTGCQAYFPYGLQWDFVDKLLSKGSMSRIHARTYTALHETAMASLMIDYATYCRLLPLFQLQHSKRKSRDQSKDASAAPPVTAAKLAAARCR